MAARAVPRRSSQLLLHGRFPGQDQSRRFPVLGSADEANSWYMKSWLELGKQQRARRNGVYLYGIIVPGHEPVPVRAPDTPKGLPAKPTAHGAQAAVTHCGQRSRARVRYRPVCVCLSAVNTRRPGSLLRRAELRQCQCLDTRAAYLDRCRFRTSEARSVDHAGVELRNPGSPTRPGTTTIKPPELPGSSSAS